MHIDLFGPNIPVILSLILACLTTIVVSMIVKKSSVKRLLLIVIPAIVAAIILALIAKGMFPNDKLPNMLWLMLVPLCFGLALLPNIIFSRMRNWKLIVLSVFILLSGSLLTLTLINDAYHYYPTLAAVLGQETRSKALSKQSNELLFSDNKSLVNTKTIEGELFDNNPKETDGSIQEVDIPSSSPNYKPRKGFVYVPAVATRLNSTELPVLILMPGVPGKTSDWIDGGELKKTMDTFSSQHNGITPYVFVVDNIGGDGNTDTECVNSKYGNVETYLTKDVPTYIKANFVVSSNSRAWAIGGLSMGGMCGTVLTLRHPDVYKTFLNFGGEDGADTGGKAKTITQLFNGSEQEYNNFQSSYLMQTKHFSDLRGYFAIGRNDEASLVKEMNALYAASQKAGITSTIEYINGAHDFNVWASALRDSIPSVSNHLGATDCAGTCH